MSQACWLFLAYALCGCGAAASDFLRPTWEATVEACYQKQIRAVERAGSREEAVEDIELIRARCDQAYEGLRAAGGLLEVALPDED